MQNDLNQPLFLERRSYRQRRMMDAVRLLPVIGLMLWLLPTFWSASVVKDVEPVKLSQAIIYVFGVWLCLILAGGVLWRLLVERGETRDPSAADNEAVGD